MPLLYAVCFFFQFFVFTIDGGRDREGCSPKSTMDEQKYSELWPVYAHNWPNVVNSCNAIIEVGRACTRNHHCVRGRGVKEFVHFILYISLPVLMVTISSVWLG